MTWHPRQLAQQTGRTFVITGANSGIGREAARDLVARGATVVLAVRDLERGAAAAETMLGPGTAVVQQLDLADLEHLDLLAEELVPGADSLAP